jgi:glycolate oxidase FAD binding subunit
MPVELPRPAPAEEPALSRLLEQVRAAAADRRALCLRGGGSKDFYGGAPHGEPLSTTELRGICSYEPTEMVITARAGTPLAELEAALDERGQCLAFEPPRFPGAVPGGTVGGMVAAGLAGPARASVGSVRDFLLGAVLVNGAAQTLRFGGQVMKNVAGYDISRVLPGSMGILGIVCEVSIKVLPRAPARATLVFDCEQAAAIGHLHAWTAAAMPVSASAWEAGRLHLRLAGAAAAVSGSATRLQGQFGGRPMPAEEADAFWEALRDQRSPYFTRALEAVAATAAGAARTRLWRLSLPSLHPPLELAGELLVEWGGAQRWLLSDAAPAALRAVVAQAGGHASVYRSAERTGEHLAELPENLKSIHKNLKKAFDPECIFNPGRLYSWL